MKLTKVKLSDVRAPEKNVRIHTQKQLKEMVRSITMFDQIRPLVLDENNTILCGNGLYEAMNRMGREEADAYIVKGLTENQKKKLMIADNKVYSLGVDDLDVFNEFLSELQGDFDIPGFDETTLQALVSDAEEATERISEYGVLEPAEVQQIHENEVRTENRISQSAAAEPPSAAAPAMQPSATMENAPAVQSQQDGTEAETRQCVICPKCGERIWL